MGHSWREMDPVGAAESDRLGELSADLLTKAAKIPLTKLTLGDVLAFMNVARPTYNMHEFNDRDADVLRKLLQK